MNVAVESEFELHYSAAASKHPSVSVIVSTFNRCGALLTRSINSILNQTFTDFELILIDDSSTDGTREYCTTLGDPRVHFYHFKKNSGIPAKRYNFGISVCRGKYVTFMFDDDELELRALEDLYQGIEKSHKNCGMVYGLTTQYQGSELVESLGGKWKWRKIQTGNFIGNNSVIVKRSVFSLVGGYDEDPVFFRICDWDLWWRIGRKFRVETVQSKIGIVYGGLPGSIGSTKVLDWDACKKRQESSRVLPLMLDQREPLRCKIQATLFDIFGLRWSYRFRRTLLFRFLKKGKAFVKGKR